MENLILPEITYPPISTLPELEVKSGPSVVPLTLANPPSFPIVVEGPVVGVPFVAPSVLPNQTKLVPLIETVLPPAEEQP